MTFYSIVALLNFFTCAVLAIFVLEKKPGSNVHSSFVYFSGASALWSLGYFFWQVADSQAVAIFYIRLLMSAAVFIPVTYLHFVMCLTDTYDRLKVVLMSCYAIFIFFFFVNFTSFFIAGVRPIGGFKYWPEPGLFFHPFLILWFASVLYAGYLLYQKYKTSVGIVRSQIRYVFLGMFFGFIGGATNYFLWYGIMVLPVGNILVSVYVGLICYSILKYNLFDIKIIAVEFITALIWLVLFFKIFSSNAPIELFINIFIFVATVILGILLIKNVYREVEQREKLEQIAKDLEVANAHLRLLDQKKSEFVSIASHQLRSPITAIKGYSSMLMEGSYGKLPKKVSEVVDKIYKSSDHLVDIVEDFLNIGRIEQGRMSYKFVSVDIKKMALDLVEENKQQSEDKSQKIDFSSDNENEYFVTADEDKLRQVISNLIDNAIKYTPEKGHITINIAKDNARRKIIFSIKDTGMGMSQETLSFLFQKFSRAEGSRKLYTEGVGLGLYVASEMMKEHYGRIWAESEGEGKGATFFVELLAEG